MGSRRSRASIGYTRPTPDSSCVMIPGGLAEAVAAAEGCGTVGSASSHSRHHPVIREKSDMGTEGEELKHRDKRVTSASKGTQTVRQFPNWSDPGGPDVWVPQIYDYVESEATEAIGWYMRSSRGKRRGSRWIRIWSVVLGGIAGLFPILTFVWPGQWQTGTIAAQKLTLMPSLLIGTVALLLALDNFNDFSRGWMRYILTAFEIRAALQEFRMNWAAEWAKRQPEISKENIAALLQLAKDFVLTVEQLVGQETRQWATEFAQNLAQMEKDVAARWEERQKKADVRREATKPGAIQLTVPNAKATDDRKFDVVLRAEDGTNVVTETSTGSQTWVRSPLPPGMYAMTVQGTINHKRDAASRVVQVKPGEICEVRLALME
jgi:hypothetical protein